MSSPTDKTGSRSPSIAKDGSRPGSSHVPSLREKGSDLGHAEALTVDDAAARRAAFKIDIVVIPLVGMYYLLSFLDRSNIGNAKIAGLTKDLKMSPHQFSVALTITYVPYILMELPMNLLMKRLGANRTLPIMVILWGAVCAAQGAVKTYHSLLITRFFLGALEGGLFPGIVLYLSSFYKRHGMQFRFAMMFSSTSLAGAFSGLLAAAIQNLHGKRHLAGWAWIFIIEGAFTSAFGLATLFFLPATPRDINWLTEHEKSVYMQSLADDWSGDNDSDGEGQEVFSWSEVGSVFINAPHTLLLCIPLFFSGVTLFGLANFSPTIVNALGHSPNRSQLLTVPPYACSFVISIAAAYLCDKYKSRGLMTIACSLLAAIGYAIFLGTSHKHADYAALYLQIIGVYCIAPCLSTWNANNVQPHYRRATAVALSFVSTNTGGIVSTWLFTTPPRFHTATCINLAFSLGMALFSAIAIVYLKWRNTQKHAEVARLLAEHGAGTGPGEWDSKEERRRLGDRHPRFEFTL
ncbi:MFS general substrate transporter [Auriscalpium vulgare]|uniref:MFS general substrate transporter n=1 Tax=Auriscalpium vulgare TaxID=40419 RepID=A0ACB8S356_9AGAM|nr:MFS general substrate transporter [Auriscalpium vulgare]